MMEITDEREREKNKKQKGKNGGASYSEIVRAKSFCWAFKLGFFQLICKAPLIFKPNLALSVIDSFINYFKRKNYISQSMFWWSVNV